MIEEAQIEAYIGAVTAGLDSATFSERELIAGEIAGRLRGDATRSGSSAEQVLEQLGTPEQLAKKYLSLLHLARASRSYSPLALLRASFGTGSIGVLISLAAMLGYWLAGTQVIFGFLGLLWQIVSTSINPAPSALAAHHSVPILFASAAAVLAADTLVLQLWLRAYLRKHSPLAIQSQPPSVDSR